MERIFFLGDADRFYLDKSGLKTPVTLVSGFNLDYYLEKNAQVSFDMLILDGMAGTSVMASYLDVLDKTSRPAPVILVSPSDYPLSGALADHPLVAGIYEGPALLDDLLESCRRFMKDDPRKGVSDDTRTSYHGILGVSAKTRNLWKKIDRYAASRDLPVLILGENGTGKELVARALHKVGHGDESPFVPYQASFSDDQFLASDLFGVKKGAFTGAENREGLLIQAERSVFFLDEIGLLSGKSQMAMLRALQEKKIRPLGSSEERDVDFRLISATNDDLRRSINEGRFRADLFHRINTLVIKIPPLRERKEDILLLAETFCARTDRDTSLTEGALAKLYQYEWPGNIRELQNVIRRAVVECGRGGKIETRHILFN